MRRNIISVRASVPVAVVFGVILNFVAMAQSAPPSVTVFDGTTPGGSTPGSPAESYHLGEIDTINIATGHVNFAIPVAEIIGRGGAKLPILVHQEVTWQVQTHSVEYGCTRDLNGGVQSGTCQFGTAYVPVGNPNRIWANLQPDYVSGVMQARAAGDNCTGLSGNTPVWANALTRLSYTGATGTEIELRDQLTNGKKLSGHASGVGSNRGTAFLAFDGSSARFVAANAIADPAACNNGSSAVPGTLYLRDGSRHTFDSTGRESQIEDRNGNVFVFDRSAGTGVSVYDPLGRKTTVTNSIADTSSSNVLCTSGNNCSHDTIVFPGSGGSLRTVTIWRRQLSDVLDSNPDTITSPGTRDTKAFLSAIQNTQDTTGASGLFVGIPQCGTVTGNSQCNTSNGSPSNPSGMVAQIDLPDGTSYKFKYTSYGDVSTVLLPTGGKYTYSYTTYNQQFAGSSNNNNIYDIRRILEQKRVYNWAGSATPDLVLKYSGGGSGSGSVTYSDGSSESHTVFLDTTLSYDGTRYKTWNSGLETNSSYFDVGGATLKSVVSQYTQQPYQASIEVSCWWPNCTGSPASWDNTQPVHNPLITTQTTTLGSQASQQTYAYDLFNNRTSVTEYDYGNVSTPIRTTTTTFLTAFTAPQVAANVLDLPSSIQVKDSQNNIVSTINYTYDSGTLSGASYTGPGRCGPNFGTPSGPVCRDSTSGNNGNITGITQLLTDSVNGITNRQLTTTYAYDILGNVVQSQDPRGVRTVIDYTDAGTAGGGTYALPTKLTRYPHLNGSAFDYGNSIYETFSYDYNNGKMTGSVDWNGNSTTYQYNDGLERLRQITRPDSSVTSFTYNDGVDATRCGSGLCTSEDTRSDDTTGQVVTRTYYDGLGRKSQNILYEGTAFTYPYIASDFTYDNKGRPYSTSNPYRITASTDSATTNVTRTTYDGLDRVLTVTRPDGTSVANVYTGPVTAVTEHAQPNVSRVLFTDALGRLTKVMENCSDGANGCADSATTPTTRYGYDALNNLINVDQASLSSGQSSCTHSRCFSYDWLKRLTQAINPESGVVKYQYDDSGNISRKTDGRTISTSFGTYDGMNRPVSKSYSDGTTASVFYCYGDQLFDQLSTAQANCPGVATSVPNGKGQLIYAGQNGSVNTQYTSFSNRGFVSANTQTTGGTSYTLQYSYWLSGKVKTTTYPAPSNRVLTFTYDTAGRPQAVSGTGQAIPYATVNAYAAHGAIQQLTLGNNLVEQTQFDSQTLHPLQIAFGSLLTLGYSYNPAGQNNGNIKAATISRSSGALTSNLTQTFSYDAFNRLTAATETNASSAQTWTQGYSYDQFGNRWIPSATSYVPNTYATPTAQTQYNSRNQWLGTGAGYDSAGNQTALTSRTFGYDAESRLVSSTQPSMPAISYLYDGLGKRVQKIIGTGTTAAVTTYVYDAFGELAVELANSNVTSAQPVVNGPQYLSQDMLGSVRLITDSTGAAAKECYDYLPFGEDIPAGLGGRGSCYGSGAYPSASVDVEPLKFTGKERDAETGLDYFGARYFSSAQGRFTSTDRVIVTPARMEDPQRFNLYSYARNNPFKFIDPTGEDIDFANDTEEGRKKALELITKNLSANEAANIGIRQAKSGSYEAYVIDAKAFGKDASSAYTQLTGLIGDHSVVADVGVIGGGLTATFKEGAMAGFGPISSWSNQDSVFSPNPGSNHLNVLVTQGDLPGGSQVWCCGGKAVYQGVQPDFVTMWHELMGETLKYRAGHENLRNNPDLDSRTVIKIENEIRAVHGMNPRTGADHGQTVITVSGKVQ